MLRNLVLLHYGVSKPSGATFPLGLEPVEISDPNWLKVKTCLRSFWVGFEPWVGAIATDSSSGLEVFRAEEAYRQLLEISCGLKSPILGETEVFGQIKDACTQYQNGEAFWQHQMQRIVQRLFSDVKIVRSLHLKGTGARSYGGFARKFFKDVDTVRILGAGKLVREALPWINKEKHQVLVHCRNPKTASDLGDMAQVEVVHLEEARGPLDAGLMIAAPLSAKEINRWINSQGLAPCKVLDLREESSMDSIKNELSVTSLHQVFQNFEKNSAQQELVRRRALEEIESCVQKRFSEMEYRPFGWDDLCAV